MSTSQTYGLQTLNDNWFEDRLQPAGSLSATGAMHKKSARKWETDIANIGERYDVLARISRVPPKESYATPDDGFKEMALTSRTDFAHPSSRKDFVANPPEQAKFITKETVPEVCYEDRRPVLGNARGFGAPLNRHEEGHEQRYWDTTQQDTFGKVDKNATRTMKLDPSQGFRGSGITTADMEVRISGMKVGRLCGEDFRESMNPAMDTRTQRSWMYQSDPALKNIHHGGSRPAVPKIDNELSLPLGEGCMKKIRADLEDRKGRLYRTATQITKGNDKRFGVSIFKDS